MPSRSVLLVEDNALLRECLAELLGDAGWQVTTACDAANALEQLDQDMAPDVLVTDLILGPGPNGLALIAEARRRQSWLRVVLTSGANVAGLDTHPADRFLGKPFSMDALIQAVAALMGEPSTASGHMACQP